MSERPRIMLVSPRSDLQCLTNEITNQSCFDLFKVDDMAQAPSSALSNLPDLVILDLTESAHNDSVLEALKNDERTSFIPIISMIDRNDGDKGLQSLASGAADYLVFPCYDWELIARVKVHLRIKEYQEELTKKNRELEDFSNMLLDLNSRLEGMARKDELTRIWNRRAFKEHVENIHYYSIRYQHAYCLIMADLDYFKSFNDTYGHQAGDDVLKAVASTLTGACRSTDFVARFGGEEFVVLLPETDGNSVEIISNRVLQAVWSLNIKHENNTGLGRVTISMGIAEYPAMDQDENWEQVLRRADEALYAAKSLGRNRACFSSNQSVN